MGGEPVDLDRSAVADDRQVAPGRTAAGKDAGAAVKAAAERYRDRDSVAFRAIAALRQELYVCLGIRARADLDEQAGRAARLRQADDVISNTGTVAELRQAVDRLHEQYLQLAQTSSSRRNLT